MPKLPEKTKTPIETYFPPGGYLINTFLKPVLIGNSRRLKVDGVF